METEFKTLLDREKQIRDVQRYFKSRINTLRDMVNYGSWLIPRAYDSSAKGWAAMIVIGVLLKQVVMMIDSIEVLISSGISTPGLLQGRAAFEASLYVEWILKEDSENRAKHYYVSNLRNKRNWALRMIVGTPQEKEFSDDTQELRPNINFDGIDLEKLAKEQLADINRILSQGSLKTIDREFEELSPKKTREPHWYAPITKKNSLRKIAANVNRMPEYIFYYGRGSEVMHSSLYSHHIEISKQRISLKSIRNLSEMNTVIYNAMVVAIHTYRIIILKYRPGENRNFSNKYTKDWKKDFLNIPSVKYQVGNGSPTSTA